MAIRIRVQRTIVQEDWILVETDDLREATCYAENQLRSGNVKWQDLKCEQKISDIKLGTT